MRKGTRIELVLSLSHSLSSPESQRFRRELTFVDNRDKKIPLKIKYEKKHIAGVKKRVYARIETFVHLFILLHLLQQELCVQT